MTHAATTHRHVRRSLASSATVAGSLARTWDEITNVDIANYPHPTVFKLAGIPHPLRAELLSEGVGGERIAYFNTGKRFIQRITVWAPPHEYAFTFNPEAGFRVGYFFDLSDGVIQLLSGSYLLTARGKQTNIVLRSEYSIDARARLLFGPPVAGMLRGFQRYLLNSITRNVERDEPS